LELVLPPISNQEAFFYKDEPVAEFMKQSDFYMIGGKSLSVFGNFSYSEEEACLSLDIFVGGELKSSGAICFRELSTVIDYEGEDSDIKIGRGEGAVEIGYEKDGEMILLSRFSPEGVLWYRSGNASGIVGFDNFAEMLEYDLLYIGIAKVGDSHERLIKKGHQKRQEILSNEPQRYPGARVADEVFLFLFDVKSTVVTQIAPGNKISPEDLEPEVAHKRVVADAEKAFVSLLKPDYNAIKFAKYPKGADGLFDSNLDLYSYSIGESITFNTAHGKIKGCRNSRAYDVNNKADFILVDKESATLFVGS